MNPAQLVLFGAGLAAAGSILGYLARQSIAKRQAGSIEAKLHQKVKQAHERAEKILEEAKAETQVIREGAKKEEAAKREELFHEEKLLLKRSTILDEKFSEADKQNKEIEE